MNYIAAPLSRQNLRDYTKSIRKHLGLENTLMFPVLQFLEALPWLTGDDEFYYEVVEDWELPINTHAEYDLNRNCIKIKQSVYDGACAGNGRDRMTIIHEIGHMLLLRHSGIKLQRSFSGDVPSYQDPEWQAKCFAGELMIPADLTLGMSPERVATTCGVSLEAARYQLGTYKRKKSS